MQKFWLQFPVVGSLHSHTCYLPCFWNVIWEWYVLLKWSRVEKSYPRENQGKENNDEFTAFPKSHSPALSNERQLLVMRSDSNYPSFLILFSVPLVSHRRACSPSPQFQARVHKAWDITLCFLVCPELLFPAVRKIQTHTPLAIWPNLLRPDLFECFRPHMALIMKPFLAWSLTAKIIDSVSLGYIPFSTLIPLIYVPSALSIFQSTCLYHFAFRNYQIL